MITRDEFVGGGGWMLNLIHAGGHYFFIPFCKLEK